MILLRVEVIDMDKRYGFHYPPHLYQSGADRFHHLPDEASQLTYPNE